MFQTFETIAEPHLARDRVRALRALMQAHRLGAYLIPRADEHQGEYVPPCAERLRWITGFSGSAGLAAVALKSAALFVDGRYTVQARHEVDGRLFSFPGLARANLAKWLAHGVREGEAIGFDPWLHTIAEIDRLRAELGDRGLTLKPVSGNLIDRLWGRQRPPPPASPVVPHPLRLAGRTARDKIEAVQKLLKECRHDAVVLTAPESIAWVLNIRGADVPHNPVTLAFAIIPVAGKVELFIAPDKLTPEARSHLEPVAHLRRPADLRARLSELKIAKKRVRLDPNSAAFWLGRALGGPARFVRAADPCVALKAIKNSAEIKGARSAQERDAVAVVRFLTWLDRATAKGSVDEITAVRELEGFRRQSNTLREISFDTIAGSGPNGAIVHYRVNEATNRTLQQGELFLIDSGGQYVDGTTDITRTVAVGTPSQEMRQHFTLVLKGHIAIATARFPKGTRGIDLDPFARRALWQHGLDYDHGTGHGVGSFLSVHEGPQSISKAGMAVLEPGMILSNEPGYYREGAYGIRIENLVLVRPAERLEGGEREVLSFETLTLVPIDRRLVVVEMLSAEERVWLDAYHARVAAVVGPRLDAETRAWLDAATAPL